MIFKSRLAVLFVVSFLALIAYAVAEYYAPAIVTYVVEEALIQKSPRGWDPAMVRRLYKAHMDTCPNMEAKLKRALALSQYLEKLQELSGPQLEDLIGRDAHPRP